MAKAELIAAGIIPLTMFFSREPAVPMIMSIYVTLGIFRKQLVMDRFAWSDHVTLIRDVK